MTNKTEDKQNEQVENYVKSQNDESNKHWKTISLKLLILLAITLLAPFILKNINWGYLDFWDYIFWLGVTIYAESFFIYFIKKIIPRINLLYIRVLLAIILIYLYNTVNSWEKMEIFVYLFYSPQLCRFSYSGSHFITAIILTIVRTIKKQKIYDEEMKKALKWLWFSLLILIWLFLIYDDSILDFFFSDNLKYILFW